MICNEELALFDLNDTRTVAFLETLIQASNIYGLFHKYVCLFICVFGSLANVVHIFVLTRPHMQKCAVNRLLSIIAVCDIFTMLSYLIFIVRFGFAVNLSSPPPGYALKWIVFLLTHVVGSIALHSITLYLSCVTAYIRYKTLKTVGSKWNHENSAGPIFVVVATFVLLLCIPTFLIHSVVKVIVPSADDPALNDTLYTVGLADFSTFSTCFVFKLNLWLTGIMFKVIPCILLMMFTVALLWELELNRRRRKLITSGSTAASRKNTAQSDRTTKVLIILLIIFLCTEFPQGVLAILNGLFPNDVHQFVYLSLGEFLDLLSLINCNTCFIIYPLISTQYRETLKSCIRHFRHRFYHCDLMRLWYKKVGDKAMLANGGNFCSPADECKECRRRRSRADTSGVRLLSPNTFTNGRSNSLYNYNNHSQRASTISLCTPVYSSGTSPVPPTPLYAPASSPSCLLSPNSAGDAPLAAATHTAAWIAPPPSFAPVLNVSLAGELPESVKSIKTEERASEKSVKHDETDTPRRFMVYLPSDAVASKTDIEIMVQPTFRPLNKFTSGCLRQDSVHSLKTVRENSGRSRASRMIHDSLGTLSAAASDPSLTALGAVASSVSNGCYQFKSSNYNNSYGNGVLYGDSVADFGVNSVNEPATKSATFGSSFPDILATLSQRYKPAQKIQLLLLSKSVTSAGSLRFLDDVDVLL